MEHKNPLATMNYFAILPREVRYQIYATVFEGSRFVPSLFVRKNHPTHNMFEHSSMAQVQELVEPAIPLQQTCKFFREDAVVLYALFTTAALKVLEDTRRADWEWYLKCCSIEESGQCSRIRSIEMSKIAIDDKQDALLDYSTFPNLCNIHLPVFDSSDVTLRLIHNTILPEEPWPCCMDCGMDGDLGIYCSGHTQADPARFALESVRAVRSFGRLDGYNLLTEELEPQRLILDNFFNDFSVDHDEISLHYKCQLGYRIKQKILDGGLHGQLSTDMHFPLAEDAGQDYLAEVDDYVSIKVHFSSEDWILRYIWEDVEYEIPQLRPTMYDSEKQQFV